METFAPEQIVEREKEILAQGWTRQFTVFATRVQEYVELYKSLGYDVRVEQWALSPQSDPSCADCTLIGIMRTIFTRKKGQV